jgi:hypothetical protein
MSIKDGVLVKLFREIQTGISNDGYIQTLFSKLISKTSSNADQF